MRAVVLTTTLALLAALLPPARARPPKRCLTWQEARERLEKLRGKPVRIVFVSMDDQEYVCHARVQSAGGSVRFDQNYTTRPGAKKSLAQEYLERKLDRPLLDRGEDRKLLLATGKRIDYLESRGGQSVRVPFTRSPCLIVRIEPLDLSGPAIQLATRFRKVRIRDAFESDRPGQYSGWGIEYGLPGETARFRHRLKNVGGPVTDVVLHDPQWSLDDSGAWVPVVPYTVYYRGTRYQPSPPSLGRFVLDRDGHLAGGRDRTGEVRPAKEYLEQLRRLREKSAKNREPGERKKPDDEPGREDRPLKWTSFTSTAGRFAISLPGDPRQVFSRADGYMTFVGPTMYAASYFDVRPRGKDDTINGALDRACDAVVATWKKQHLPKGEVVGRKKIQLGKHPGREVEVIAKGSARSLRFRVRVYFVERPGDDPRVHVVGFLGLEKGPDAKDADRFLGSLKLR